MGAGSTERLLPAGAPLAVQWGLRGRGLLPPHRATDSQPPPPSKPTQDPRRNGSAANWPHPQQPSVISPPATGAVITVQLVSVN